MTASYNPLLPGFTADPYPHYRALAQAGPLVRTVEDLWVATGHTVCSELLADARFGHGPTPVFGPDGSPKGVTPGSFPLLDPPEHTRLRALVAKAFTARTVARMRDRIGAICTELLDPLRGAGPVDFVRDFAYPVPVRVICEILGIPRADEGLFGAWSTAIARGTVAAFLLSEDERNAARQARAGVKDYFRALVADRRDHPRDDLTSDLVRAADAERLSEVELITVLLQLLVGGHETTANLLGNGLLALLRHDARPDPSAIGPAVEELLRYDAPVQLTQRTALADAEIAGHPLKEGEQVLLLLGAANRDPAVFPDPDSLDLARTPNRHLGLGRGVHFCVGAPLARTEAAEAFPALTRVRIRLLTDAPSYSDNFVIRCLTELPIEISG